VTDPPDQAAGGKAGLPELRASDADREQAVEQLRRASEQGMVTVDELEERVHAAYQAKTRNQLQTLLADLSTSEVGLSGAPMGNRPAVREGPGGGRWCLSIMSGHERKGRWRVAPHYTVINLMGGSDIDLTQAELAARETQITVYSIMGGGEVRVPHGVEVSVSQFALMGGNDVKLGDESAPPGGPVIRVRLFSLMGGTSVRRGPRKSKAQRREERRLREAERRRELES
jgi:hypothetical protein